LPSISEFIGDTTPQDSKSWQRYSHRRRSYGSNNHDEVVKIGGEPEQREKTSWLGGFNFLLLLGSRMVIVQLIVFEILLCCSNILCHVVSGKIKND